MARRLPSLTSPLWRLLAHLRQRDPGLRYDEMMWLIASGEMDVSSYREPPRPPIGLKIFTDRTTVEAAARRRQLEKIDADREAALRGQMVGIDGSAGAVSRAEAFRTELVAAEYALGRKHFPHEVWPYLSDINDIAVLGPQLPSLAEVERFGEVLHHHRTYYVVRLIDDLRHPETGEPVDWWTTTRDHAWALDQELRGLPLAVSGNWTKVFARTMTGDFEIWGRP